MELFLYYYGTSILSGGYIQMDNFQEYSSFQITLKPTDFNSGRSEEIQIGGDIEE
jgi:hypothetical protein